LGHHGDFAGRTLDRFRQADLRLPSFAHSHFQFAGRDSPLASALAATLIPTRHSRGSPSGRRRTKRRQRL